MRVPFNKPYYNTEEISNITEAITETGISAGHKYTKMCQEWFVNKTGHQAILTVSCTAALEMAGLLADIKFGDEVIMPSFTFVSTANAFVLRGAVPVFVDININTLNIDENLIEDAITEKTKAIVVMHYAGVACNMDKIKQIANKYNLLVIEDAAHAFGAKYKNEHLGCIGDIGCFSFHETKNVSSGEGGAIAVNNKKFEDAADIICEKGTNIKSFVNGDIDKYTWINLGSSYKLSDINAALLYPQLKIYNKILEKRLYIWNLYNSFFEKYEREGYLRRPFIPEYSTHNAHIFYIVFNNNTTRNTFINYLKDNEIDVRFHYVPLHSSSAGKKYGRISNSMNNTETISDNLVRLPLFYDLTDNQMEYIFSVTDNFFKFKFGKNKNFEA